MRRGALLWLFGVLCGAALSYWALGPAPGDIPRPAACAPLPPAEPVVLGETECASVDPQTGRRAPVVAPAAEAGRPPGQPATGSGEEIYDVLVLVDVSYLDPAANGEPLMTGGGPPATLVCDYRSQANGKTVSKASRYDSTIRPPPSCPFEIREPLPLQP